MTTDDDARDLAIHRDIEASIKSIMALRPMLRADVLMALKADAPVWEFPLSIIREKHLMDEAEMRERVEAFLENDPEGEAIMNMPDAYMLSRASA